MTKPLLDELKAIVDLLEKHGVEYALCGGVAVTIHGHVRSTKDIDLLIPSTQLEEMLSALASLDFVFVAGPIPFAAGTEAERSLYRASRVEGQELLTIDLLLVTPIFEDVWRSRQVFDWRGRKLPVVSLEGLAKMKRLANRRQDLADLENLGFEVDNEPL